MRQFIVEFSTILWNEVLKRALISINITKQIKPTEEGMK